MIVLYRKIKESLNVPNSVVRGIATNANPILRNYQFRWKTLITNKQYVITLYSKMVLAKVGTVV